jgi:DNA helicase-2/ATP-dependent DNA helicase PcrA
MSDISCGCDLVKAKGRFFRICSVFIAGCEDGILPLRLPWLPPADLEEERRLLYVGMTRAQQRLILNAAQRRNLAGRTVENRPCPFLDDMPADLLATSRTAHAVARPASCPY